MRLKQSGGALVMPMQGWTARLRGNGGVLEGHELLPWRIFAQI